MRPREADGIIWIPRRDPKLEAELDEKHERIGNQLKWKKKEEKKKERKSPKKASSSESPVEPDHDPAGSEDI